jgi:hypothetical protein
MLAIPRARGCLYWRVNFTNHFLPGWSYKRVNAQKQRKGGFFVARHVIREYDETERELQPCAKFMWLAMSFCSQCSFRENILSWVNTFNGNSFHFVFRTNYSLALIGSERLSARPQQWDHTGNKGYPSTRPWRPIKLRDVKDPSLSRKSAHS